MMRWVLRAAMLVALATLLAGQAIRSDLPPFLYTAAPRYEPAAWTHGGERFLEGAHLVLVTQGSHRDVAPGFFASADAAVSYDARLVLFAGRPTRQDPWQIGQTEIAGATPQGGGCLRCLHPPPVFTGWQDCL